jgi:hypothetical protein
MTGTEGKKGVAGQKKKQNKKTWMTAVLRILI